VCAPGLKLRLTQIKKPKKKESDMSQSKPNQVADAETEDSAWKSLCKIGGAAALIATALF
jgi:hypothetical protein